jgi:phosphoadenosine phosphosulfate reductase
MKEKIEHSIQMIKDGIEKYGDRVAVGCSWGKDSMVLLHLALQVNPDIPIFSILTIHKPKDSFDFVVDVCKKYNIKPNIYMVANEIPTALKNNGIKVKLLSPSEYNEKAEISIKSSGKEIYYEDPNLCCQLLKVVPIQHAYFDLNLKAWFSGLRNTEGATRNSIKEIEYRSDQEVKINPIISWSEKDIWEYIEENEIPTHPWYKKEFSNGKRIRSLGCEPCTVPIFDHESERDGRWRKTNKKAGECGIHTNSLRDENKNC